MTGGRTLRGGSDDDTLIGTEGDDWIEAEAGRDHLEGRGGDDTLFGGFDADALFAGAGEDELHGGEDNDYLNGGEDADALRGGPGNDMMRGDWWWQTGIGGDDWLQGDDGDDNMDGGPGNDTLRGGGGRDEMWGGEGNDNLDGGTHNDPLHEYDLLFGGDGDDRLYFNPGARVNVDIDWREPPWGQITHDGGAGNDALRLVNDNTVWSENPEQSGLFGSPVTANTVIYGGRDGTLSVYHKTLPNNDDGSLMARVRGVEHIEIEAHGRRVFYATSGADYVELQPDENGIAHLDWAEADQGGPAPGIDAAQDWWLG